MPTQPSLLDQSTRRAQTRKGVAGSIRPIADKGSRRPAGRNFGGRSEWASIQELLRMGTLYHVL